MMPFSVMDMWQHCGGACCFHLHATIYGHHSVSKGKEEGWKLLSGCGITMWQVLTEPTCGPTGALWLKVWGFVSGIAEDLSILWLYAVFTDKQWSSACCLTLKMKALLSFRVLAAGYQSTQCNIPEDSNIHVWKLCQVFTSCFISRILCQVLPQTVCLDPKHQTC